MTTHDIEDQVKEIYGVEVSEGTISIVTNRLIDHLKQCKYSLWSLFILLCGWMGFL